MLKENQTIKITAEYYKKYISLSPDKQNDILEDGYYCVAPQDLPINSHIRVKVLCDSCGKEVSMEYRQYTHKTLKYTNGKYHCKFCAAKTEEVKQKRITGMIKKYGVINPMLDDTLKKKCMESCLHNGKVPTSKAQLQVFKIITTQYDNCYLNFIESNMFLDCVVVISGLKIDVEYDGWYWHQDVEKDKKRDSFLLARGYKILRIKGGRKPPQKDELLEAIRVLRDTAQSYYEIILSDYKEIAK